MAIGVFVRRLMGEGWYVYVQDRLVNVMRSNSLHVISSRPLCKNRPPKFYVHILHSVLVSPGIVFIQLLDRNPVSEPISHLL